MMKQILSVFLPLLLLQQGCSREQVETYKAPKEPSATPQVQAPSGLSAAVPASGRKYDAKLPEGWTEKPGTGMRMVNYTIEGTSIDFYLISLSMGDVPSNVNRWRGQVGLPPASQEAIEAELVFLQADGREIKYIEIYNEEGGKGIIAAIVDLSPQFWYFTAKGTVDELKANAPDIHLFLESLKVNH